MSAALIEAAIKVYRETEAHQFGRSSAPVTAAEDALRETANRNDAGIYTPAERAVVEASYRVLAVGGFVFDRSPDKEPSGVHDAEAAWGQAVRHLLSERGES